jgi:hypothetical protein
MRRAEPYDPEVEAALAAIEATLAGEPVDPDQAELAELSLILRAQRPEPTPATAVSLDERVQARIAPRERPRRPRWHWQWLGAPAAAAAAIALVVVVAGSGSGGSVSEVSRSAASASGAVAGASSSTAAATTAAPSAGSSAGAGSGVRTPAHARAGQSKASSGQPPSPSTTGQRQVVQSAQLALSTAPNRIDQVAQEVFDVVDDEKGNVSSSHVTATGGLGGSASFQLSVPVGNLQQTMSELSQLRGAHVQSRTDDTTDITGQVGGAGRRLAEARALRRSLLRQLGAATTQQAIDSLKAQLRDADAAIGRDASALSGLHNQVSYSRVAVTIQAANVPVAASHGSVFTLRRAVHDAGRVVVVVAGVALIALAVLVPLGLVLGLVAWAWLAIRRRRREAMLDVV